MKKQVIFFLIFSLVAVIVSAEEPTAEVENPVTGETERVVTPETYAELREAYLEMAELYLGERADLDEAMDTIDEQQEALNEAEETIAELQRSNETLIGDLEKESSPDWFRSQVWVGASNSHNSTTLPVEVGMDAVIRERFVIGVGYQPLMNASLRLGVQF